MALGIQSAYENIGNYLAALNTVALAVSLNKSLTEVCENLTSTICRCKLSGTALQSAAKRSRLRSSPACRPQAAHSSCQATRFPAPYLVLSRVTLIADSAAPLHQRGSTSHFPPRKTSPQSEKLPAARRQPALHFFCLLQHTHSLVRIHLFLCLCRLGIIQLKPSPDLLQSLHPLRKCKVVRHNLPRYHSREKVAKAPVSNHG